MKETSPASFTPPWQATQFLLRIGCTSLLKSASASKGVAKSGICMKNLNTSFGNTGNISVCFQTEVKT
jgi:hypothetical protein